MGSKSKISTLRASTRRLRRKSSNSSGSQYKPEERCRVTTHNDGGASVSDKLEALKKLIPSEKADMKPEQLFEETADYIVLLKTQVFVLQKLIHFYGSQNHPNAL